MSLELPLNVGSKPSLCALRMYRGTSAGTVRPILPLDEREILG